jgi:FixJ family two-component response regulator
MKVLIVDDDPHIRTMMRLALEAAGYEADEAEDGEKGLAQFHEEAGYSVVVLDQRMPGLDGLETLARIRERVPDARVLMATAFGSIELAVDAMRLGASDFLRKPMTPEMLRSAVAAAVAREPSGRPVTRREAPFTSATPAIQTLTLNGFQILPSSDAATAVSSSQHGFRVKHFPDGAEFTVAVAIDPEAVERIARLTRRRLEPRGAFWRLQAERLLSAHLWTEGKGPDDNRLTVFDVSREDLDAVAAWTAD